MSEARLELTAELAVDGAELLDPVISPDGRLVAYVVSTADGTRGRLRTLWVAPADASSPPRTLAAGPQLTGSPRWAPDSASLVVIADRQLHRIGLDGGDPTALTSWRGDIAGHLPLADGRLAVIATDEPDAQDERRKADGDDALMWGQDVPGHRLRLLDPVPGGLAWAVGQTDRFKAALMGAGISDWGMQVGVGELGIQEAGLGGSCGWESPGPHRHQQLSPISYASKVRTPVLILHGQEDTNVPLGQAVYFHRALSRYGVEHELVVYPREGHSLTERQHQIDVLQRTRAWFARWLGGPSAR
jgi:dipeptidyl aminopeptidase/acylaminoacyl peptidase